MYKEIKQMWFFIFFIGGGFLFFSCGQQEKLTSSSTFLQEHTDPITPLKEYTIDNPREWAGMEDQLIPQITFNKGFGADIIVRVNLKNPGNGNYIEKIGIMDEDGKELVYDVFSPYEKFFEAHFFSRDLPFDRKGLKVFSKSSLYDLWTTPLPEQF